MGPDFIIIGAQISGTTALYEYLVEHPDVFDRTGPTEVGYFGREHFRRPDRLPDVPDDDAYLAVFQRPPGLLAGEKTPEYMIWPDVESAIRTLCPRVRLLAILRDPVDRLESRYRKYLTARADRTRLSFAEFADQDFNYCVSRGRYAEHLQRWFALWPREQLLVSFYEGLCADPAGTMATVDGFLGLAAHPRAWRYPPPREQAISQAEREAWTEYYRPHNAELAELLAAPLPPNWDGGARPLRRR